MVGRKSTKKNNEIKNIANVCDAQTEVINFYKHYSTMMHSAG